MTSLADEQRLGVFALVSYVPDPLGSFLSKLRQSLPGDENPQPHITILPPRPLLLPVEAASLEAKQKLAGERPFEVQLDGVKVFSETSILYLDITDGSQELSLLHARLNAGSLYAEERFAYSPHVTISGSFAGGDLEAGRKQADGIWNSTTVSKRLTLREVAFVWQADGDDAREWRRLWSFMLATTPPKAAGAATPNS